MDDQDKRSRHASQGYDRYKHANSRHQQRTQSRRSPRSYSRSRSFSQSRSSSSSVSKDSRGRYRRHNHRRYDNDKHKSISRKDSHRHHRHARDGKRRRSSSQSSSFSRSSSSFSSRDRRRRSSQQKASHPSDGGRDRKRRPSRGGSSGFSSSGSSSSRSRRRHSSDKGSQSSRQHRSDIRLPLAMERVSGLKMVKDPSTPNFSKAAKRAEAKTQLIGQAMAKSPMLITPQNSFSVRPAEAAGVASVARDGIPSLRPAPTQVVGETRQQSDVQAQILRASQNQPAYEQLRCQDFNVGQIHVQMAPQNSYKAKERRLDPVCEIESSVGLAISLLKAQNRQFNRQLPENANSANFLPYQVIKTQHSELKCLSEIERIRREPASNADLDAVDQFTDFVKAINEEADVYVESHNKTGQESFFVKKFKKSYVFDWQKDALNYHARVKTKAQKEKERDAQSVASKPQSVTRVGGAMIESTRAYQAEIGVLNDGRVAGPSSGRQSMRMGIGAAGASSSGKPRDQTVLKNQLLHKKLQMASATSVPVSGVSHTAKTGQGDLYDSFRTARSIRYHVAAETRQKDLQQSQLQK